SDLESFGAPEREHEVFTRRKHDQCVIFKHWFPAESIDVEFAASCNVCDCEGDKADALFHIPNLVARELSRSVLTLSFPAMMARSEVIFFIESKGDGCGTE